VSDEEDRPYSDERSQHKKWLSPRRQDSIDEKGLTHREVMASTPDEAVSIQMKGSWPTEKWLRSTRIFRAAMKDFNTEVAQPDNSKSVFSVKGLIHRGRLSPFRSRLYSKEMKCLNHR
jgi:hypothetical protein